MVSPKLQPGSSVWYRITDTGYESKRSPDANPPSNDAWIRGHVPKTPEEKIAYAACRSASLMGRVMTPEWKAKMSLASKGKPKSEAHKLAMSISQKARAARLKGE